MPLIAGLFNFFLSQKTSPSYLKKNDLNSMGMGQQAIFEALI